MKYKQKFSIRKNVTPVEFARGIWNPKLKYWRDVIEDYLYVSRKRKDNKLCIFKLQLNMLSDIMSNYEHINSYKNRKESLESQKKKGEIEFKDFNEEIEYIESEIALSNSISKALREIADGIVWRYFNFNRAILYMLADKPPIETIERTKGTQNELDEFADAFLDIDSVAIYNDITNFLRVGDVTKIGKDGTIEIIEVKSGNARGRRITRQKQRMGELVDFFNTGLTNYDGKQLAIVNSEIKQKNYLSLLHNSIKEAKSKGTSTLVIGKYLILEIVDFRHQNASDSIKKFKDKHKSIRNEWEQNNDRVVHTFFTNKMKYSRNCAPYSIYPFDVDICADIITGAVSILVWINHTEILRKLESKGWKIIDSLVYKSKLEIEELEGKDIDSIPFLKIKKNNLIIEVPPSTIARIQYELLSINAVVHELDELIKKGPDKNYDYSLVNYVKEQDIWM